MLVPNKYLLMAAICKKLYTSFAENIKINQSHVLFEIEKSMGMQKRLNSLGMQSIGLALLIVCMCVCLYIYSGFFWFG